MGVGVDVTNGVHVLVDVGTSVGDRVTLGVLVIVGEPTVLVTDGVVVPPLTVINTQKD